MPYKNINLPDNHFIEMTTSSRDDIQFTKKSLAPLNLLELGGAGKKCSRIVMKKCESYFFQQQGLSYWDICGPESVIKGIGGYATNIFNQKLRYDDYSLDDKQVQGLILANTPNMHKLILSRLGPTQLNYLRRMLK